MRLRRLLSAALCLALAPLAFAITDRDYSTNPLMQNEVRTLKQMLDFVHFNKTALKPEEYPQLITDFMALLDPQHLYFTSEDEQSLRRLYGPQMEDSLLITGNIDPAFRIFGLFEQRVRSRVAWVHEQLAKDLDLTTDETYGIDRFKAPWPANTTEADQLWSRRLRADLIAELLNKKTPETAKQTLNRRFDRFLKNISELQPVEIESRFLTSLTRLYDPHSAFFSAPELADFNIDINLNLEGIGAVLTTDDEGYCKVVSINPGSPAELTGKLKPNDKIVAVQQDGEEPVDVVGMRNKQIVQMIRGKKGTKVILHVIPQKAADQSKTELVAITRDSIKINQARASAELYELPDSTGKVSKVGVISFNSFYGETGESGDEDRATVSRDVAELIGKLKKEDITALVIDLRRNGGGLLSEAINLSGLFIDHGPVVQVRDSAGRVSLGRDNNGGLVYDGPLAILTSRFSASASEIFAGAMQNYGRAIIIGDSSTYGKGTVQTVFELQNYLPRLSRDYGKPGAAKLTIQKYYLPNGSSTQKRGVLPDIVLPSIDEYIEVGEATEPNALVWDEISAAPFDGAPLNQAFVEPILNLSKQRQDKLEEFNLLKRNIDWFRQRTEQKTVSLNLEKRRTEKSTIEATTKKFDAEYKELSKTDFTKREIKLDGVVIAKEPEPTPEDEADGEDHADAVKFDVHLREALRVVVDATHVSPDLVWVKRSNTPSFFIPGVKRG